MDSILDLVLASCSSVATSKKELEQVQVWIDQVEAQIVSLRVELGALRRQLSDQIDDFQRTKTQWRAQAEEGIETAPYSSTSFRITLI